MSTFIECEQGSEEWLAARAGKTTASEFGTACEEVGGLNEQQALFVRECLAGLGEKDAAAIAGYKAVPRSEIIRRALAGEDTTSPSDAAIRYAADIAIERISGKPYGAPIKAWTLERGKLMESEARMIYEARGAWVTESGICISDNGLFGYSTDGLVDDDGLLEIKSPVDSVKISHIWRTGDLSEYMHQMQGGMWLTGRKWCDFMMYVPDLKNCGKDVYIKRVMRDDEFIDAMVSKLWRFQKMVDANVALWNATHENQMGAL